MIAINSISFVVIFVFLSTGVFADIYDNKSVVILRHTKDTNSYFGYSVFLQKGFPARVVIGAPKHGRDSIGSVFVCPLRTNEANSDSCKPYSIKDNNPSLDIIYHDNLFGAAIDGGTNQNDIIMIGAPKYTVYEGDSYFTNGAVFKLSDLENNVVQTYPTVREKNIDLDPNRHEYQYGYAECGFSINCINSSDFLYGLPGYGHWRGQAFHTFETEFDNSVPEARRFAKRPRREIRQDYERLMFNYGDSQDAFALAGYAVTSGNFFGHLSFAIGLPNGNEMMGSVKLYTRSPRVRQEVVVKLKPEESKVGDHFGSVLCAADVNGDGFDDLLIGAPNYAEHNSFDNGIVYVYLSDTKSNLMLHQTIKGKIICRFGSSITNLGKISLDSHDAVAIGSPYEDGVGAVHVYVWSNGELVLDSRIKMTEGFKAFGYSLSRAVDIDSNNIADFAVGDYRSNSVAILKAKSVFFYDIKLTYPTIYTQQEAKPFDIRICISVKGLGADVDTEINLELDTRLKQDFTRNYKSPISQNYCIRQRLDFQPNAPRIDPLNLIVKLHEADCYGCPIASPTHPKIFNMKIPFNYNCKHEICQPEIMIVPSVNLNSFTVGEAQGSLKVHIKNTGDPAFACSIEVLTDPLIDVTSKTNQCKELPCRINHIIKDAEIDYQLHLDNLENVEKYSQFATNMKISINVSCVNISTDAATNLLINYKHTLDISGSDITEQYDSVNRSTFNVQGELVYLIKNNGPSPMQEETFTIRIPRIAYEVQIIDIYWPDMDGYELESDEMFDQPRHDEMTDDQRDGEVAPAGIGTGLVRPNLISCEDPNVQCMTIRAKMRLMSKLESRTIKIPIKANISEILKHYRSTFTISSQLVKSDNTELHIAMLGIVDAQTIIDSVSLWIIIVSIILGLVVMAVIIYVLRKLHFFSRPKRDRLIEEKEQMEMEGVELNNDDNTPSTENAADIDEKPDKQ